MSEIVYEDGMIEVEVFSINGPARLFGFPEDKYFSTIMERPGSDLADHNPIFMAIAEDLSNDATIIDIGANIGVTTIPAARLAEQGRVISIEPSPMVLKALNRTVVANELGNVTVVGTCLSDTTGEISFVEARDFRAGAYIGANAREESTVVVPMTTLDHIALAEQLDRIDLVKIDVEGYELDVLYGATRVIDQYNPKFVMEFNSFALTANRNISPRALLDFIVDRFGHFHVWRNGAQLEISNPKEVRDFIYGNMVAFGCVEDIVFGRK